MVAVERVGPHRLGRVRFGIDHAPGTLDLIEFATAVIKPASLIRTDGAQMFRKLPELGYSHEYVTGYNSPAIDEVLPGVHLVASLLKRWIAGTLHHHVSLEHLPYYLDEYSFRFNRRNSTARGMLFYRLLAISRRHRPAPTHRALQHLTALKQICRTCVRVAGGSTGGGPSSRRPTVRTGTG